MQIKNICQYDAEKFIKKYHYSKIMPKLTKYYLGFFENEELTGVITLGWGTQPLQTIRHIFYNHKLESSDYLEIGKMCFLPKCNKNKSFGSQAISMVVKWLKENTKVMFLYTLADGIMGKCGYVYQASNFKYIGSFKTSIYMDKATGEKIHPRSAKSLCIENAKYKGVEKVCWLTDDFCKYKGIEKINGLMFRYILPLNKQAKKILNEYNFNLPNPKDKDLKFYKRIDNGMFEEIERPQFNMDIQNYNYQKNKKEITLFTICGLEE